MDIPFSRWYPAIEKRRSRRLFDRSRPIQPEALSHLDAVCKGFFPFPHARACLVTESVGSVFTGIVGSYGQVKNAPAFVAFIGDIKSASVQEEVGYTGEAVILEATALGLDTCWVGGFFSPDSVASLVEIRPHERVLAVTPVGHARRSPSFEERLMSGFGRSHRRLPVETLVSGLSQDKFPEWVRASIQAARLAPSAVNRQPWGFDVEDNSITVYVRTSGAEFGVSKRLDCGIAMLHVEVAAMNCGVRGTWEFLDSPKVAKFSVLL